jgi:hypothetical protein
VSVKRQTTLAGAAISSAVVVVLVAGTWAGAAPSVGGLRTVRVGPFPYAMALDARTGHLVVVNQGQWKQAALLLPCPYWPHDVTRISLGSGNRAARASDRFWA